MKPCKKCGKLFFHTNKRTIYCSTKCYYKAGNDKKLRLTEKRYSLAEENYKKELTEETKQIIYGSLLGDGTLIKSTKGYRFSINQCAKFIDYLEWKKSKTSYIFQQAIPSNYKNEQYFYHSISHPFFCDIYPSFYKGGIKIITRKILDKINPLALAIWYQDDGSFNSHPYSRQAWLCTDSFTLNEHILIKDWFMKRFKIEVKIQHLKKRMTSYGIAKPCHRIRINKFEVPKLISVIRPFIQSCMSHKLPK